MQWTFYLAVLESLQRGTISGEDVVGSAIVMSQLASEKMGGTSGALYSYVLPCFLHILHTSIKPTRRYTQQDILFCVGTGNDSGDGWKE